LLLAEGFNQTLAGIRLLGRDMSSMATVATGEAIKAILETETGEQQRYRFVQDMAKSPGMRNKFDDLLIKIKKLTEGYTGVP
jgi:hypothetical protein